MMFFYRFFGTGDRAGHVLVGWTLRGDLSDVKLILERDLYFFGTALHIFNPGKTV